LNSNAALLCALHINPAKTLLPLLPNLLWTATVPIFDTIAALVSALYSNLANL
jgi:hypothetical protein